MPGMGEEVLVRADAAGRPLAQPNAEKTKEEREKERGEGQTSH